MRDTPGAKKFDLGEEWIFRVLEWGEGGLVAGGPGANILFCLVRSMDLAPVTSMPRALVFFCSVLSSALIPSAEDLGR